MWGWLQLCSKRSVLLPSDMNTLLLHFPVSSNKVRTVKRQEKNNRVEKVWGSRIIVAQWFSQEIFFSFFLFCGVCFHGFTSVPRPVKMWSEDIFWEDNKVRWAQRDSITAQLFSPSENIRACTSGFVKKKGWETWNTVGFALFKMVHDCGLDINIQSSFSSYLGTLSTIQMSLEP